MGLDPDRADRALRHLDAVVEIERHAEREDQRGADHVAVADDRDRVVGMSRVQVHQRLDDAALHLAHRLAAGDGGQTARRAPQFPARVGTDRVEGRAGPLAVIELGQIVAELDREAKPLGQNLGTLAGALQRTGIDRRDRLAGKALGDGGDLGAAALGQRDPRHSPDQHLEQVTVAMPQEVKDGHASADKPSSGAMPSSPAMRPSAALREAGIGMPSRCRSCCRASRSSPGRRMRSKPGSSAEPCSWRMNESTWRLNWLGSAKAFMSIAQIAWPVLVGVVSSLLKLTTSSPLAAPFSVPASSPNISDIAAPL